MSTMKKEIESNKHYEVQTRNCSDFAKAGVEAASGEKIDYKIITTPKKLYNDTKEFEGTRVVKSHENSFFKKYISF